MRLATFIAIASLSFAQSFEVASIREAPAGGGVRGGCHGINSVYTAREQAQAPPVGQCIITDARLSHMIGIAYGVTMQNLKTGPEWIQRGDLRFNIQAKAEDPSRTTEQQLLTMLQNLLVERFQLKFHYDTTQVQGFALSIGKSAPKLTLSTADEPSLSFRGPRGEAIGKPIPGQPISLAARKFTMKTLTSLLSQLGAPIVDRTGLTGEYDFTLTWDEDAGPALSTAFREQLGLILESTNVPVSTFIVDSAEKPSAN
jgi:uncharacterized protein (TIGR03435 family)